MALFGLFGKKKEKFSELDKAIKGGEPTEMPSGGKVNSDLGLPIGRDSEIDSKIDDIDQRLINIERLLVKIYQEKGTK